MSLQSFNIVLLGNNIPVESIVLTDFSFRHRELLQTLRVPVALQAEARGVKMSILPERFEVAVVEPYDMHKDAAHLTEMTRSFFEYVGPRSLTAAGHNFQFTIEETANNKDEIRRSLLELDRAQELIGRSLSGADAAFYFKMDPQSVARLAVSTMADGDVTIDVNVNYDRSDIGASDAVGRLGQNLDAVSVIVQNFETKLISKART